MWADKAGNSVAPLFRDAALDEFERVRRPLERHRQQPRTLEPTGIGRDAVALAQGGDQVTNALHAVRTILVGKALAARFDRHGHQIALLVADPEVDALFRHALLAERHPDHRGKLHYRLAFRIKAAVAAFFRAFEAERSIGIAATAGQQAAHAEAAAPVLRGRRHGQNSDGQPE